MRKLFEQYNFECIISCMQNPVRCHIYPAGAYPELKMHRDNIIPLLPRFHTTNDNTFDWVEFGKIPRSVEGRIEWIMEHCHGDHIHELRSQISRLMDAVSR